MDDDIRVKIDNLVKNIDVYRGKDLAHRAAGSGDTLTPDQHA